MGTALNFDPFFSTAKRTISHRFVRYFFFFTIGVYLLSDFWNQRLQYEGHTHASAVFTLSSGALVGVTSVVDMFETWNLRQTSDERLEAIFIGIYSILIVWLGWQKMIDAKRSNVTMDDSELYALIGSFSVLTILVCLVVYITN